MDIKQRRELEIQLFDAWYPNGWDDGIKLHSLSPIEKIFFLHLMKMLAENDFISDGFYKIIFGTQHREDVSNIKGIGKFYIIDFVIGILCFKTKKFVQIAIELDGHDFHEKTKHQAKKDKEKDRLLQAKGYLIARFTGSEVWENPAKVLTELAHLAGSAFAKRQSNG